MRHAKIYGVIKHKSQSDLDIQMNSFILSSLSIQVRVEVDPEPIPGTLNECRDTPWMGRHDTKRISYQLHLTHGTCWDGKNDQTRSSPEE